MPLINHSKISPKLIDLLCKEHGFIKEPDLTLDGVVVLVDSLKRPNYSLWFKDTKEGVSASLYLGIPNRPFTPSFFKDKTVNNTDHLDEWISMSLDSYAHLIA